MCEGVCTKRVCLNGSDRLCKVVELSMHSTFETPTLGVDMFSELVVF